MIRDFVKDLLKYLPAQIAPATLGFIAVPIITRLFTPSDYGEYALVMATVSVMAIAVGWLSMSIIRFYPAYEKEGRLGEFHASVVKLLLVSVAIVSAVFVGVLLVIRSSVSEQLWHLMLVGTLVFVLMSSFHVLQQFLRARRQLNWYTGFSIAYSAAALAVGVALVMALGYGIDGMLWGSIMSLVVVLPLLFKVAIKGRAQLSSISGKLTREMAAYGFPLVLGNLAAWILSLSDRYVLGFYRGAAEVGIYSANYVIAEHSILLLASVFMLAWGPIGMSAWEKDGVEKSRELLSKVTRYYLLICFPAVVGLSVLARPAAVVLTAAEYHEGYSVMVFVAFGGFFLGLQQRFQSGLLLHKKTAIIFSAALASVLLNLGLNFLLVPRYGYIAAAVTTLISYAFLCAAMAVVARKYFVWDFPLKSLGRVLFASAVMAGAVYWVGNGVTHTVWANLVLGVISGAFVYGLVLVMLGELRKDEVAAFLSLAKTMLRT